MRGLSTLGCIAKDFIFMVEITFIFGLACTLCGQVAIGVPAMLFALAWAVLEKIVNSLSVDNGCGM